MKKMFGLFLIAMAAVLFVIMYVAPAVAEKSEVEAIRSEYLAYAEETVSEPSVAESSESSVPAVDEVEVRYDWFDNANVGDDIGVITIPSASIETVVGFGGSESEYIDGKAGIHEQLSTNNSLFILGHHYNSGTGLVFTDLDKVCVGDTVNLEVYGQKYDFVVTETKYVTAEEYAADGYAICKGNDLTLATCEWDSVGNKGRQIVICEMQ